MHFSINLELPNLGKVLAQLVPMQLAEPKALRITNDDLELDLQAPLGVKLMLLASVTKRESGITLSQFQLSGGGTMGKMASGKLIHKLHSKFSELDTRTTSEDISFHIWGESDGERLHIEWA